MERCLFAEIACESVTGENEATVGGFGSAIEIGAPSSSRLALDGVDIRSSQGVSWSKGQISIVRERVAHAQRTIAAIYNVIAATAGELMLVCDPIAERLERRS